MTTETQDELALRIARDLFGHRGVLIADTGWAEYARRLLAEAGKAEPDAYLWEGSPYMPTELRQEIQEQAIPLYARPSAPEPAAKQPEVLATERGLTPMGRRIAELETALEQANATSDHYLSAKRKAEENELKCAQELDEANAELAALKGDGMVMVPSTLLEAATNYIKHVGANHI